MPATVSLNIYDLAPYNAYSYWCGVGIFHSGVEVYGVEYAYGGHDYEYSGVFATAPRDAPGQVIFRQSVPMGETDLTQQEVQQLVSRMGNEYKGNRYHLLQRNCNHFASDLCKQLIGRESPQWINRLAGIAVMLHCLLPASWVPSLVTPSVDPHEFDNVFGHKEDKSALLVAGQRSEMFRDTYAPSAVVVPSATR